MPCSGAQSKEKTIEIDVKHRAPVLCTKLVKASGTSNAGIAKARINAAKLSQGLSEARLHRFFVGDITDNGMNLLSGLFILFD